MGPAVVGGLISGVVVLLGVLLAEILNRQREQKSAINSAVKTIAIELPILCYYFSEPVAHPDLFEPGFTGWEIQQRVYRNLIEIDMRTRTRKGKYRETRNKTDDISSRMAAAIIRRINGIPLTEEERLSMCTNGLFQTVFGDRDTLDGDVLQYIENGLPID